MFKSYWPWVVIAIIIISSTAIRIHLLDVPLERDEGEYAYAGQLILQGIPPYAQVYNMKMPGIYAAYALILAVFGQTLTAIHLGLLLINTATIFLLFQLGKKCSGNLCGVTAAAAFAILSLGQPVQGIFANAEHFVILPVVGGVLLLLHAIDSRKRLTLLTAAVLLGLGFIMKQHGAVFILFGGLYLLVCEIRRRPLQWSMLIVRSIIFSVGVFLPFVVTCLILWQAGVFEKFWFWTFDYASKYVSSMPISAGLTNLRVIIINIIGSSKIIWIVAGIGLTSLIWNREVRSNALFVAGFFLFSFLAVCPGLYFRPHYFVLFLPAVALLAGIGVGSIHDIFARGRFVTVSKVIPFLLVLAMLFHAAWEQRKFLFVMSPTMVSRSTFGANPFPESLEIARFLREHSQGDDRIAIIGSEPQIYFYSNRRAATGYVYTYALMESHPFASRMQQEMIREIESIKPQYLIFVNIFYSWLATPTSDRTILEWFRIYSGKYYELVGLIDILGTNQTVYQWNKNAVGYSPRSRFWLSVYRLKS
jgi:hypothetical protein